MPGSGPEAAAGSSRPVAWRRWGGIEPLLDAALDLPAAARAAYLKQVGEGDAELGAALQQLIQGAEGEGGILDGGAAAEFGGLLSELAIPGSKIGERVGPYEIVGEAGRGGMGVVYLAERADQQYTGRVALKLLRPGLDDPFWVQRFLRERQVLATLEHRGIARLFDGGMDDGRPWFAMEYVDGVPIDAYCHSRELSLEQRLELFLQVCSAVAYAHRRLVIHRDLKPSNVLVDTEGSARLLDFGIAKVVQDREDGDGTTRTEVTLLTPDYASPEQLRGGVVSTATDVYSLAAMLYELLAGTRPFEVRGRPRHEVERAVLEEDPMAPSEVVRRAGVGHPEAPRLPWRKLRGDVDTIILKALQKEPERRYSTVDALAADVRRYLEGAPVVARRDTWRYRSGKFVRRHRAGMLTAAAGVVLLAAFALQTRMQLSHTETQRRVADQVTEFLASILMEANPSLGGREETTIREVLDRALARLDRSLKNEPAARVRAYDAVGGAYWQLGLASKARTAFDSAVSLGARDGVTSPERMFYYRSRLTAAMAESGEFAGAISVGRTNLTEARAVFGARASQAAGAMSNLGEMLAQFGSVGEAESLLRESLAIRSATGARPIFVAATQAKLADLLADSHLSRDAGKLAEADSLSRVALATAQREIGERGPMIEGYYRRSALLRHRRGDHGGDTLMRAAHDRHAALWGADHLFLDRERSALAAMAADHGAYTEAESLYRRVIVRARSRGATIDEADLLGLGRVYLERRNAFAAESLFREAYRLRSAWLPANNPKTAEAEALWGAALAAMGRNDEALPLLREAVPIVRERWGDEDPRTAVASAALARAIRP